MEPTGAPCLRSGQQVGLVRRREACPDSGVTQHVGEPLGLFIGHADAGVGDRDERLSLVLLSGNGDTAVNFADFLLLADNFGKQHPGIDPTAG